MAKQKHLYGQKSSIWRRFWWLWLLIIILAAFYGYRYFGKVLIQQTKQQEVSLSKPLHSNTAVKAFASKVTHLLFTYNASTINKQLSKASGYFTPEGWRAFENALNESHNLTAVKQQQLDVSAFNQAPPTISVQGVNKTINRYQWAVELPLNVIYQGKTSKQTQSLLVRMVIVRTKPGVGQHGLGVSQLVASPPTILNPTPASP